MLLILPYAPHPNDLLPDGSSSSTIADGTEYLSDILHSSKGARSLAPSELATAIAETIKIYRWGMAAANVIKPFEHPICRINT